MDLLKDLTEPQREAITYIDGPLLVVAGAGSGKTRVITRRIGYLAQQGVNPYNILALTFTNKAANEMKERVEQFCPFKGMWVSTFHSMCARILRVDAEKIGYSNTFSIYDKQDQTSALKIVMAELEIDSTSLKPAKAGGIIGNAKNNMVSAEEFAEKAASYTDRDVARVYSLYEKTLKKNNALDFDDLLLKVVELFQNNPDVLEKYQDKFKYILIDEYQDTNRTQYAIAKLLTKNCKNICATGDPDQSIYSWRGADLRNILDFEKDFKDAKLVRLEQNYRSTKMILRAASEIIKNNSMRKEKELWTENDAGSKIKVVLASDDKQEAAVIVENTDRLTRDADIKYADVAVFYRTNAQSRVIESALRDANIPYTIVGSVEFYRRKEVKDILAYLKLCVNPNDDIALSRIINVPTRGIGKVTLERLSNLARENNCGIFQILSDLTNGEGDKGVLKGKSKAAVKGFVEIFAQLKNELSNPVNKIVDKAIELTNYKQFLIETEEIKSDDKIRNIEELISAAREYDMTEPEGSLGGFLENVALVADLDNWDDEVNAVTLMTLHAAKGLEFSVVFLVGLEEGLLPIQQSRDNEFRLEEERRLCYVGITRAKKELILTRAVSRYIHGQSKSCHESRFLEEIPSDVIEFEDKTGGQSFQELHYERDEYADYPEFDDDNEFGLNAGDYVRHPRFGPGRVMKLSGYGDMAQAVVKFNMGGTKSMMIKYAKLEKV